MKAQDKPQVPPRGLFSCFLGITHPLPKLGLHLVILKLSRQAPLDEELLTSPTPPPSYMATQSALQPSSQPTA